MRRIIIPALKVKQPIGTFFIGVVGAKELCDITFSDIRGIERDEREIVQFTGIQRNLNLSRVKDIKQYVHTVDASFPTSILLAVEAVCVSWNDQRKELTLSEYIDKDSPENNIPFEKIAKIIDGQHRIAGLEGDGNEDFEVNITIFIDIDIAEQAQIFSVVNLAQTKVNKSLVYDLFDYAKKRSPQKTCHSVAVALNDQKDSPFYQRIKRLGVATEGVFSETITQATFVKALIVYISGNEMLDRDLYLRGENLPDLTAQEKNTRIFREFFVREKDIEITKIIWTYFAAIEERWPLAWAKNPENPGENSFILNKTNGFCAFMRFLKPVYLFVKDTLNQELTLKKAFADVLKKVTLKDADFTTEHFKPGSSGESALLRKLKEDTRL